MTHPRRPFLLIIMLLAIGLRTTLGAPCCMPTASAADATESAEHAGHMQHANGEHHSTESEPHSGHGDDPSAKPCCSACGPTLPPEPSLFIARTALRDVPQPSVIRTLATRPPFPAYDATGPPLLI